MTNSSQRPLRILHIVGGMNRGGVETWLMHVLRTINHDRFQMDFLVHTAEPCPYDEEVRSWGSKIIPCSEWSQPLRYAHQFKQLLSQHGPYDIVHSHVHHYSGFTLRLAHQVGVPVRIAHSHNDTGLIESKASLPRRLYLNLMKRWINRYATLKLACSEPAAVALYDHQWKDNPLCQILFYGIDLTLFQAARSARTRADLGIPPESLVIGHVGRFASQKNHTFLIKIAAEVIQRVPTARFFLIGDGLLRSQIQQEILQAGLNNAFILVGLRDDVPQLMLEAMDIFLLPSLNEGLPMVLIEAQAAGLPCIFTDTITYEIECVPPLLSRFSLSQPAAVWAEGIIEVCKRQRFSKSEALATLKNSSCTIQASTKNLEKFYTIDEP